MRFDDNNDDERSERSFSSRVFLLSLSLSRPFPSDAIERLSRNLSYGCFAYDTSVNVDSSNFKRSDKLTGKRKNRYELEG